MVKHILVPVDGTPLDERALSAAFGLARLFAGHADVLHIRPDPRQNIRLVGEGFSAEMLDNVLVEAERAARESAENARRAFDHAVSMTPVEVVERPHDYERFTAWWRTVIGGPGMLGHEGRCADLVLFAQAPQDSSRTPMLEAALFDSGRPLLLASAATAIDAFPSVAVAWDGSLPAVRAVGSAMPFLSRAATVTILTVDEGMDDARSPVPAHAARLVEHLAWHGIDAVVQSVRRQDRSVGEALAGKASELGAGLLVMGGYGHSRFREMILGGATRHMLGTPLSSSVLMVH